MAQQEQWTQKSRAERNAKELEAICKLIDEGPNESTVKSDKDPLSRLITLCSMTGGTDSLRDYIRELLLTGMIRGLPQRLLVYAGKGKFGVFDSPIAREFERKQILINQPIAITIALAFGEKKRASQLLRRIQRWKGQFEKLYGEEVTEGINKKELARELEFLKGSC